MRCSILAGIVGTVLMYFSILGWCAPSQNLDVKPASPTTLAAQARMRASLPPDNGQDDGFVHRGFIATAREPLIHADEGHVAWNLDEFAWIKGDAPPTVNPSLWRQMKLLKVHGLFKVTDNVWQVRGFDASNMTVVKGNTGWIVIDPLWSKETGRAAIALVNEQLGKRPVSAVIYSHSHPDHFGGVRGVIGPAFDPKSPPPIIAPEHFMKEVASEWVIAGPATGRRASFHVGSSLPISAVGSVGAGLSENPSVGLTTLIPPTDAIKTTGETRVIDGVKFEFQMVPETEAPSEMNFYLPEQKTLFISEIATCSMHNVQTPRGALVRDALKWAGFLTEALNLYGDRSDAVISGHCWPRFGNDVVKNYLGLQRDNYKFIHDQTVRLMNRGETPTEIAEEIKLPTAVANEWSNRGYYGTVRHNAKGVFQRYIGWWDGIPAHLNLYPPVEQGKRYVKAMGGAGRVINEAKSASARGDYRWSAELLNHLVFAAPANQTAKALLADSYEQMGYQSESAVWRNYYLSGAKELRDGISPRRFLAAPSPDLIGAMPLASFLDLLATRLNPDKIGERVMTMALDVTDSEAKSLVSIRNAVLVSEVDKSIAAPSVSVSGTRAQLMGLFLKKLPLEKLEAGGLKISGDRAALLALQDAIETPPANYPIVTP
jgi:alkyl sulfatase BDS1-like metallo-beta-lactamase superfamily hydrolase